MKGKPYLFTKKEFEKLVMLANDVIIKPNGGEDEIVLSNGKKIYIDVSFEKEKHAPCVGKVMKVPKRLIYDKKSKDASVEFKVDMELKVGDNAFFHFLTPQKCIKEGRWVEVEDDGIYFVIKYDEIYCAQRGKNKDVVMVNGWLLIYPIEEPAFVSKLIIVPDHLQKIERADQGIIAFVGSPVQEYFYQQDIKESQNDVKAGDRIYFEPDSDIPLQYEMHRNFEGKKNFFRMQRKDIFGIIE